MGRAWRDGVADGQAALLPVGVRDLLPAGHLAFDIVTAVERFDLSGFEQAYRADGRGRPPYHPRVMVALLLYCRAKGLMSGRQVAAACHDDLGARLITGNRYPDRSTIDRFHEVHESAIHALLPQTLRLAREAGLVDVRVVAGDGTKIAANAAKDATVDEAALLEQIADLHEAVQAAHRQWAALAADTTEQPDHHTPTLFDGLDGLDGLDGSGVAGMPDAVTAAGRKVQALTGMLQRRRQALAWLREHPNGDHTAWQQRLDRDRQRVQTATDHLEQTLTAVQAVHDRRAQAAATGRKLPGPATARVDDDSRVVRARDRLAKATTRAQNTQATPPTSKVNTTDPSSAIMPSKHGGYDQNHNVQAMASKDQLILAIGTHLNATDTGALPALTRNTRTNLDTAGITETIGTALFDSGYASETNFTTDLPITTLLVGVHPSGGNNAATTTLPPAWQPMANQLTQPDNAKLYRQRAAIIEPVFAHLFNRFDRTLFARHRTVDTELHLWAATHNLLKIRQHTRHRRRHR